MEINARLWVLNFSDGEHSLLDIAERSGLPFSAIADAADVLLESGLLSVVPEVAVATQNARVATGNRAKVTSLR